MTKRLEQREPFLRRSQDDAVPWSQEPVIAQPIEQSQERRSAGNGHNDDTRALLLGLKKLLVKNSGSDELCGLWGEGGVGVGVMNVREDTKVKDGSPLCTDDAGKSGGLA